jgi:hypothetical protein
MKPVKTFLFAAVAAAALGAAGGCAQKDPYEDTMYTLQRNLRHRNDSWGGFQDRQRMRREARDDRYDAWFNSVME